MKNAKLPRPVSKLEETLALHIRSLKLLKPVRELQFHPTRNWRFDFAWPEIMLAAEVEGGTVSHGQVRMVNGRPRVLKSRHLTPSGVEGDCEKYNEAILLGWSVLRFTGGMIKSGIAIQTIERALSKLMSKPTIMEEKEICHD